MKKMYIVLLFILLTATLTGCSKLEKTDFANTENQTEQTNNETTDDNSVEKIVVRPTKDEVLTRREIALEGMTESQINRLKENVKVANQKLERAYLYDNLFAKLEDKNSLYWNYFDHAGDIQIGWEDDGKTPVIVYNRFDANNFIELFEEMKDTVHNEQLKSDIQSIINETRMAAETHDMEHANNIYKLLHDMDYFLLRYGIEDVGKYMEDTSVVATYYGVLSIYE